MISTRRVVLGSLLLVTLAAGGVGVWKRQAVFAWYHARQLSSVTPELRQSYVARFEQLGEPGALALVDLLHFPNESSCQNAGFILSRLLAAWGETDARRETVLSVLAESVAGFSPCGQAECVGVLQQLLGDQPEPSPAIVAVMTRLLNQIGSNAEARLASLELTSELLRHEGIQAGALVGQAKAWVVAGLRETNPQVRMAAVRLAVVPALRAHDLLPPLVVGGTPDSSPEVRQLVLLALGEHDTLLGTDDLCKFLHDENAQVRQVCERALRARGLSARQITLARLVNDPRPAARAEVPALVLQTPELDTVMWMEKLTRDPAPAVRAATARALGTAPAQRLEALLRQLAERDVDPTVQEIARYFWGQPAREQ